MEGKITVLVWLILLFIMLRYYMKKRKPRRHAAFGIFFGIVALVILNRYGYTMGYQLPVNIFNILTALILGAPGVLLVYVVNVLI